MASRVNIGEAWLHVYGTTIDSYAFRSYLYETGHVLGLGHAGPYNFVGSYGSDHVFLNDSRHADDRGPHREPEPLRRAS